MQKLIASAALLTFLWTGCAAPGLDRAAPHQGTANDYVFVFLKSGAEAPELSEAELQEIMLGHFSNMGRLASAGQLLLAGPFGEPRSDPDHRGLFLLDTTSLVEAGEWVATDPAVAAGVLDAHLHPFRCEAPLRRLPQLEREDEARRLAADSGAQWEGRSYVLVSADDGTAAAVALASRADGGRVLFGGSLGGALAGSGLFAIDTVDLAGLEALMGDLLEDETFGWHLHPWYGTRMVAELPGQTR